MDPPQQQPNHNAIAPQDQLQQQHGEPAEQGREGQEQQEEPRQNVDGGFVPVDHNAVVVDNPQQQQAAAIMDLAAAQQQGGLEAPQAIAPMPVHNIPQEWLQPGYPLGPEAQQHLFSFIMNNMREHANAVMDLTPQERQQALAIKAAVQEADDLVEIPDMRYAHLALIDGDNVEKAIDRVRHFQIFMDEYHFEDSLEEGVRMMRAFFKQQPDAILSVSYNAIDGNYVYIYDQVAFNPHLVQSPEDWRVMLAYCYYLFQAMSPDLYAIRQGCVFIGECDGYNWTMANVEVVRRYWEEVLSVYPIKIRELKCFHSGVVANLLLAILKPFFPRDLRHRINLGCQFEDRLDKLYSVPTRQIAAQRILADIDSFLERRYAHEREFVL